MAFCSASVPEQTASTDGLLFGCCPTAILFGVLLGCRLQRRCANGHWHIRFATLGGCGFRSILSTAPARQFRVCRGPLLAHRGHGNCRSLTRLFARRGRLHQCPSARQWACRWAAEELQPPAPGLIHTSRTRKRHYVSQKLVRSRKLFFLR